MTSILVSSRLVDHKENLDRVRHRLGMYACDSTFSSAVALIMGYDLATDRQLLSGFREWLLVRFGGNEKLAWPGLALFAAFPGVRNPYEMVGSSDENESRAVDTLFSVTIEFLDERIGQAGAA